MNLESQFASQVQLDVKAMTLRKCPSCKDTVGADSEICPRCGVNFRAAAFRRIVKWALLFALLIWVVGHFVLKRF